MRIISKVKFYVGYKIKSCRGKKTYGQRQGAYWLIPLDTLRDKAELMLPDKNSRIMVYCRSGKRSRQAAEILDGLGYVSIYDMGGLIDWPFELIM